MRLSDVNVNPPTLSKIQRYTAMFTMPSNSQTPEYKLNRVTIYLYFMGENPFTAFLLKYVKKNQNVLKSLVHC